MNVGFYNCDKFLWLRCTRPTKEGYIPNKVAQSMKESKKLVKPCQTNTNMALPLTLNRSDLPANILRAVDEIFDFLPDSLWTGICITLRGLSCIAKTGDTPSPPPTRDENSTDTPAEITRKRKAAASARWNANKAIDKKQRKKTKQDIKTPKEIGVALRLAQDAAFVQPEEPQGTYSELYIRTANAVDKDALVENHLFGKKLRQDEQREKAPTQVGKERAVSELVKAAMPHLPEQERKKVLQYARRIYDITSRLTPNQVRKVQGVSMWDLAKTSKLNVRISLQMCQE